MTEEELKQQLATTRQEMADAMAEMSEYCSKELTAAEEQLAEMRDELSGIAIRLAKAYDYILDGKDFEAQLQIMSAEDELDKLLSAAPKRGRMLWDLSEDARSLYHASASNQPVRIIEFRLRPDLLIRLTVYGQENADRVDGKELAVTVREAE